MNANVIIIAVLACIAVFTTAYLILLKCNIKKMTKDLAQTREADYNRELRIDLCDRGLVNLATEMNENLSYQKQLKLSYEQKGRQLEQSIADIAHDLRTPLTVVKGNLQMLEGENLSEKGREYLAAGEQRAETLKTMVDEFFELSLLESDDKAVTTETFDLTAFLTDFVLSHEVMIREKGLEPTFNLPEKNVLVKANREMLGRVFSNLLTNITKYAKDTFTLSIKEATAETPSEVLLTNRIADGETPDVDHIFDRTYRADKARSDGSAGLGLAIVKLLMEKMGGAITAAIEEDNLFFTITFAK